MKNYKTKKLVAFAATCAIGAAAITGVAFGANALLKNNVYPHAETALEETVDGNVLDFGVNTIELTANVEKTFAINSVNPGYYYFHLESGAVSVSVGGVTKELTAGEEFYVYLASPESADVVLLSESGGEIVLKLTYSLNSVELTVGSNSLTIPAGEPRYAFVNHSGNPVEEVDEEGNVIITDKAQPGDYTFSSASTTPIKLTCTVNGEVVTYTLGRGQSAVTIYMEYPNTTVLAFSTDLTRNVPFVLNISYKEAEPDINISDDTLKLGNNQVTADWFGVYYVFTAEESGTYVLNCTDEQAFIMVETAYGEEQILWDWAEDKYVPFEFTLEAGESYTFLMAANVEDMSATVNYVVNIALKA
ncbi:MAG: hypothetical protein K2H30_02055 [Clostridia bacterium]|nr:hypothetical protein [Clostridia bacterium]